MRILLAAVVALLLACLPATADQFNGRALLVTDGRKDPKIAAPLVIVLHGLTGSSRIMQRKTGFDALARNRGFVVAYPNGIARRWRDGPDSIDVAYLTALIAALIRDYGTDPARIYLVGYSNGGAMAIRMACALPNQIRAISVVAMLQPRSSLCNDARPLPALFIHGTLDPIVPAKGLPATRRFQGLFSLDETLALWAARNRCTGRGPAHTFDQVTGPDTARIIGYTGCAAPLVSAVLSGQGHDWPGATQNLSFLLGPASREMDAAAYSWRFFTRQ